MNLKRYIGGTLKFSSKDSLWFTSDLHYGHKNITIGESNWSFGQGQRPFMKVEYMNANLITILNRAEKNDHLFILGDLSYPDQEEGLEILSDSIVCDNVYIVLGNHDQALRKHPERYPKFKVIRDYLEIDVDKQRICMSHYPMLVWNKHHKGSWHLHGHSHGSLEPKMHDTYYNRKVMDVSVDTTSYSYPYHISDIRRSMEQKDIVFIDHHSPERYVNPND